MKTLITLLCLFVTNVALAGSPVIWSGNFAKSLKKDLNLNDQAYLLSGSVNPTLLATSAPGGSLYMNSGGSIYLKADDGLSTNWTAIASGPFVSSLNGRSGPVTLSLLDVTGALTYTPLNKAGDTMSGPLVLPTDLPSADTQAVGKKWVIDEINTQVPYALPSPVNGGFAVGNGSSWEAVNVVEPVPTGGVTGQMLVKKSNTNYDLEWSSGGSGGGGFVDKGGDTMTGPLILPTPLPTNDAQAVTKKWVSDEIAVAAPYPLPSPSTSGNILKSDGNSWISSIFSFADPTSSPSPSTIALRDEHGNFAAGTITASIIGPASQLPLTQVSDNVGYYFVGVSANSGNQAPKVIAGSSLKFNAFTGRITAGLSGTADYSDSTKTVASTQNVDFPMMFASGAGMDTLKFNTALNFNPSTGILTLPTVTPSTNYQAASKKYVDDGLSAKQASLGFTPVNKAGDTMSGPLVVPTDTPTLEGYATSKKYVDTQISAIPTSPSNILPKNMNGDFQYWQRGTPFANPTPRTYTADMTVIDYDVTTPQGSVSQQTFTLGQTEVPGEPARYLQYAISNGGTGGTFHSVSFPILNVRTLAGQTALITFYAKFDTARTLGVRIKQNFGTGGSPSVAAYSDASSLSVTDAWAKYSVQVAVPSLTGKTIGTDYNKNFIELQMLLPVNTALTFSVSKLRVWGSSSEPSDTSIDLTQDWMRCQAYFSKSYFPDTAPGTVTNTGWDEPAHGEIKNKTNNSGSDFRPNGYSQWMNNFIIAFPVRMVFFPSVQFYNPYTGTAGKMGEPGGTTNRSASADGLGEAYVRVTNSEAVSSGFEVHFHYAAKCEL